MESFNSRPSRPRRERHKFQWPTTAVILLVVAGVFALGAAAVLLPRPLAWLDGTTPTADAVQANRQALLWMAGGLIAVVTLLLAGFRDRTSRQKLDLDRDTNFTARYTEAVTQLSSESLTIRLGGVYALERISQDSERDRQVVLSLFAAFLRIDGLARPGWKKKDLFVRYRRKEDKPEDVATVITVLAKALREKPSSAPMHLDAADLSHARLSGVYLRHARLRHADLFGAHLQGAHLQEANFTGAYLRSANFTGADLSGAHLSNTNLTLAEFTRATLPKAYFIGSRLRFADFTGAHLHNADFTGADLTGANFTGADLTGADLHRADLTRADLTGADLHRAELTGADLTGADLTGADLRGANLRGANRAKAKLERVRWDSHTVWPDAFEPPASA